MLLHGLLTLQRATTGTVALVTAGNAAVLAVASVASNGRFIFEWPPLPPGSLLYGFPGRVLPAGEIADALAEPRGVVYEAIVPLVPTDRLIFVNAASTAVCAALNRGAAFEMAPALA